MLTEEAEERIEELINEGVEEVTRSIAEYKEKLEALAWELANSFEAEDVRSAILRALDNPFLSVRELDLAQTLRHDSQIG